MKSENREKNLIGITMGDPGGIGPEVILEALASPEIRTAANYVIIGSEKVLSDITGNLGIGTGLQLSPIDNTSLNLNRGMTDDINVLDLDNVICHTSV